MSYIARLRPAFPRPIRSPRIPAPFIGATPRIRKHTFLNQTRSVSDVEKLKSETSENEVADSENSARLTGVMDYSKSEEVLVFFDKLYPRWIAKLGYTKTFGFLVKRLDSRTYDKNMRDTVMGLVNNDNAPLPMGAKCESFVPLKRDGGAFVKFLVPQNTSTSVLVATIEQNIQKYAKENTVLSYWTWLRGYPTASQVKGTPWIEDLSRFPSRKLKVIFEGEPLTEEQLYLLFRRYGLIVDIVPPSSSAPYATVLFKSTNPCVRAKNCVTGLTLNGGKTTLHLQYIPILRVNHISQFISSHQKIAIPVILALLATFAVLVFEPIRQYFISLKIRHCYSVDAHKDKWYFRYFYVPYSMIMSRLSDGRHFLDDSFGSITGNHKKTVSVQDVDPDMFWTERSEKANQLRLWVCENANTFIVVKGPKGSAEREFVIDHALSIDDTYKKRLLEIDCATLAKARSDNTFLKTAAAQLGYFPLFTWTNSVSQFVDLGLQGLTGQKSGLSESKETQYKNMLGLAQAAIRNIALMDFSAYTSDLEHQHQQKSTPEGVESTFVPPKEEDYLQMHPEVKPVIVINNFSKKADGTQDFLYKSLADWAGQLIQSNTAHVIFITQDSGSTQHLAAALPNQVFKTISLDDASHVSARQYVSRQLDASPSKDASASIDACLEPLGGRMLDLQAFVRRVKSGEQPADALAEMVHQASEQITTFFLNVPATGDSETPWNTAQLWALVRWLASSDSIEFDDLVQSPLFTMNPDTVATLAELEKNDLISLRREKGIVKTITTGRPLFRAAFKDLVSDQKVFKLYETFFYAQLISLENAKLAKLEDQISRLANSSDFKHMKERIEYLSAKVNASTSKVQGYEAKAKEISALGEPKKSSSFFGF